MISKDPARWPLYSPSIALSLIISDSAFLSMTHLTLKSDCSQHASYFDVLPEEILINILESCDAKVVLACQLVRLITYVTILHHPLVLLDMPHFQRRDRGIYEPALQTRAESKWNARRAAQ